MNLLISLFFSFIQVGMFSVGGGYAAIPLIQDQIVNVHKLMTMAEFTDLITIAEMTPGPVSINSPPLWEPGWQVPWAQSSALWAVSSPPSSSV